VLPGTAMIFVGGPDSGPEAETVSLAALLIKFVVVAACCFEPPHDVNPIKAPAIKQNFVAPFIVRTSLRNRYQSDTDAFLLNAFDPIRLIFGGSNS